MPSSGLCLASRSFGRSLVLPVISYAQFIHSFSKSFTLVLNRLSTGPLALPAWLKSVSQKKQYSVNEDLYRGKACM